MAAAVALLGPVRAWVDDRDVTPGPVKDRTLFALLALRPQRVVTGEELIEELWDGLHRDGARHALHVRIAALRKHLGRAGAGPLLHHVGGGYVLDVAPDDVDHLRFASLVGRARVQRSRGDRAGALDSLDRALALWRGTAMCDAASTMTIDAEAHRLNEAHVEALEDRIDVQIELGRHRRVVAELDGLVAVHPLREGLWRQRIIALYRSERQAEALRAARDARRICGEQLGLDVGPALRTLEQAVREQRPELDWAPPEPADLDTPSVHYARSPDGAYIAYQIAGQGPVDVVIVPGYVSHLDTWWEAASGRLVRRLASFCRLILFDKRGTGLSDRPTGIGFHDWLADIDAVLDAAEAPRPVVLGMSAGAPIAIEWAAAHADRVSALVLYAGFARATRAPDYEIGVDLEKLEAGNRRLEEGWGTGVSLALFCPSVSGDPAAVEIFGRYERKAASPGAASAYLRVLTGSDVRHRLAEITSPTLVIHPAGDRCLDIGHARYLADNIPSARLRLLDSSDHLIWFSDAIDELTDAVAAFIIDEVADEGDVP